MSASVLFDPDLIRRFDVPGPRYTSYPTADRFIGELGSQEVVDQLSLRARKKSPHPLSLYFHIPFCNTICYYCACNKIITKDRSVSERYLNYLEREMDLVANALGDDRLVSQMHWGGGTPTFLPASDVSRLIAAIKSRFQLQEAGEYSIEIDPRKVSAETVQMLADHGFNRMSLGIQDFDPAVQRAVNRTQTVDETVLVMKAARESGFRSVSVDLIYGLPLQTQERFARTLDIVLSMTPDRLSLYNYAHLPTRFMPQRRINAADLPDPEEKLAILAMAIEKLGAAGYVYIGMDHFARPDDELAIAQRQGSLQRNFQGYSTYAECDMLGFGVSSIGRVDGLYIQNQREIDHYYAALDAGVLPVMRGWRMSEDDQLRASVIQTLMCNFRLSVPEFEQKMGRRFNAVFAQELDELTSLADAGLVELSDDALVVTMRGRMLVRIVAMVFDAHLRADRAQRRYSRVI
ncbi:MAG: oxygen-independent coproporphyrinogen III oxidase [Uliginosibacterium sp.]|nr:oxygen-independent coproporphyrinogen III oxidase [Uliginosibacterium sp.]